MKFIHMPIDPLLYLAEPKRTSELDDGSKFEATGYFQPPIFEEENE